MIKLGTYQIVIPIYAELPHIEGNLESLNDWEHLLIVDNSKDSWCKKFEGRGAKIEYHPENIGVARSWNIGILKKCDYTFFVSSSVKFNKGFKEVVDNLNDLILKKAPGIEYGLFTQLGWHCNGISKETVRICGLFDENYYPAYEEDIDYCYRLYLADIHSYKNKTIKNNVPIIVIDAKSFEIATTIKKAGLHVNFQALRNYYITKWGGDHGNETFKTPFNCGDLKDFPHRTIAQLRKDYGLKKRD
jgi:hypothetical protein